MQQSTGDFALFFRRCMDRLTALSACYADKVLQASPPEHKAEILRQIKENFDVTVWDTAKFVYTGIMCDTSNPRMPQLSQAHYIQRLSYLPPEDSFEYFRSLRAKLMWVVHTLADVACGASMCSYVTAYRFGSDSFQLGNRLLKHLKSTASITLQLH